MVGAAGVGDEVDVEVELLEVIRPQPITSDIIKVPSAEEMKKGAKIVVCPGCLKVAGLTKGDLLPGLELGTKEALFGPLDENGAVFSY